MIFKVKSYNIGRLYRARCNFLHESGALMSIWRYGESQVSNLQTIFFGYSLQSYCVCNVHHSPQITFPINIVCSHSPLELELTGFVVQFAWGLTHVSNYVIRLCHLRGSLHVLRLPIACLVLLRAKFGTVKYGDRSMLFLLPRLCMETDISLVP